MPRISIVVPDGRAGGCRAEETASRIAGVQPVQIDASAATGDFMLFLRADDEPVPYAVAALADSLDTTGSDLALGTGGPGPGSVAALSEPHTAVSAAGLPALVEHDRPTAVLWRRAFWDRHRLCWPEHPWAERAFLARAVLLATAVDVVPEPVTLAQAGGSGVDRPRRRVRAEEVGELADRLDSLHQVAREIRSPDLRRHWETTVLEPELRTALTQLGMAEPPVRDRIIERVAQVLDEAGAELEAGAKAVHRLQYHLARRRLVPQLLEVVKADRFGELLLRRAVRRGRSLFGDYPFRGDSELGIPAEVYRLGRELALRARVEDVWFDGDRLHLEGYAYLPYVDAARPRTGRLRLRLVRGGQRREVVRLPVERVRRPDVAADAREAAYSYVWSGFRTSVPVSALRGRQGWAHGIWRLEATLSHRGVKRSRMVTTAAAGRASHPDLLDVDGARVVPATGWGSFAVEVDTLPASVTAAHVDGDALVLDGEVRRRVEGAASVRLVVTRRSGSTVLESDRVELRPADPDGRRGFTASLSLAALAAAAGSEPAGEGVWTVQLAVSGRGRPLQLRAAAGLASLRSGDTVEVVALERTSHGRVALTCRPPRPVVDGARWVGDVLELTGRWPPGDDQDLALVAREGTPQHRLAVEVSGDRFRLSFAPGAVTTLAGSLPLAQGSWLPVVRREGHPPIPLPADREVLASLPLPHAVGAKTFRLTEDGGSLALEAGPDLRDDERGAPNQHRMRTRDFPRFVAAGLRDEVLFESYESRAYADNARAILEELARRGTRLRCRWVVADGQTALPDGVEPVRRFSRDYYEALGRSRYVVVPNYRHLEEWLDTPPGQVVAQTWHGAPYKRIGLDNVRGKTFSGRNYVEMLRREAARWDFLLSPNPPSTPILRRAFAYDGEVLETGYPRTDLFHAADRAQRAAEVRGRLGLPDGKRVVLYAPTMRDDRSYGRNRFGLDLHLDLADARRELADDHVLLVRRHAKVADDVPGVDGEFARDVSQWPDVNELMLATDVLVTDYSSLLFDFANTRRPMLFFTYDLEDYRDRLRGLYFDPARMPGPHLRTSQEVVAAIRDVDRHHVSSADAYRRFVDDFCPWDDGKASERFVDRVFAPHL